jgi:hypothetical protein
VASGGTPHGQETRRTTLIFWAAAHRDLGGGGTRFGTHLFHCMMTHDIARTSRADHRQQHCRDPGRLAGMTRSGVLVTVPFVLAALPAHAESDITLSATAALLTQYVDRGITNSAERPAVQPEFDLYYKDILYAGIWARTSTSVPVRTASRSPASKSTITSASRLAWANGASTLRPTTSPIRALSIRAAILIISSYGPASRAISSTISSR